MSEKKETKTLVEHCNSTRGKDGTGCAVGENGCATWRCPFCGEWECQPLDEGQGWQAESAIIAQFEQDHRLCDPVEAAKEAAEKAAEDEWEWAHQHIGNLLLFAGGRSPPFAIAGREGTRKKRVIKKYGN